MKIFIAVLIWAICIPSIALSDDRGNQDRTCKDPPPIEELRKELSTVLKDLKKLLARNDDYIKVMKDNVELSTQLEIEQSKVDQYAYQLKLLQEEIASLAALNKRLLERLKEKGSSHPPFRPQRNVHTQAQITKFETLPDGKILAQINLGRTSKVEKKMKFLVHRGDLFLGHLIITFVDKESAAGILTPRSSTTKIVPGDQVRISSSGASNTDTVTPKDSSDGTKPKPQSSPKKPK